jgi:hypothetical protein
MMHSSASLDRVLHPSTLLPNDGWSPAAKTTLFRGKIVELHQQRIARDPEYLELLNAIPETARYSMRIADHRTWSRSRRAARCTSIPPVART